MANGVKREGKLGSRRIFAPQFKLQVLDSYRVDNDCKGNQRATARKYGIHRRQIQKWLQAEATLRGTVGSGGNTTQSSSPSRSPCPSPVLQGPVDLSLKRPASPMAWDLSKNNNEKYGYEYEAPAPPVPLRPVKLFKPYLPEDNFEEVHLPECPQSYVPPPPTSAFEKVIPREGSSPPTYDLYTTARVPYPRLNRHYKKWLIHQTHDGRLKYGVPVS